MMSNGTILLIEDDEDIRESIRILLESENYIIKEAENGRNGLELLSEDIDLVILDIMMPGISGLRTCEEIRKRSYVPVLFLTAKAQESDKLIGLMVGGDDYLPKPFSYAELLGRVKAVVRRYNVYLGRVNDSAEAEEWISSGEIRIHKSFNSVFIANKEVPMSDIEYHILLLLMQHPKMIFLAQKI